MSAMGFDLDVSVDRAWAEFQRRLGDHISIMVDGDVLAVESSTGDFDPADGAAPCVQFLVWTRTQSAARFLPTTSFIRAIDSKMPTNKS